MSSDPQAPITFGHITITPKGDRLDAFCAKCQTGIEVGPTFGPVPGEVLLAEWVKQHKHTSKGGGKR